MPAVFRYKGFRFFFYSNEGHPREPVHVHVRSSDGEAKIWVQPTLCVATSAGFDARMLKELLDVTAQHRELIEEAWHDYFA